MTLRYAIYYTPRPEQPLGALERDWFGRDAAGNRHPRIIRVPGLSAERLEALIARPRRYGLHATLKPPFRLAPGTTAEALQAAVAASAGGSSPIPAPALRLTVLDGFLALVPSTPAPRLDALAAACVAGFDRFRAPPQAGDLMRRRDRSLTPYQEEMLQRWGYPDVFEAFRFHLTLTDRIDDARDRERMAAALAPALAAVTAAPWSLDALSLSVQPEPDGDFVVAARFAFAGAVQNGRPEDAA